MTQAQINKRIRQLTKRIPRLQKQADRAYKRKHNIIAVNCLNIAVWCEEKIKFYESLKNI